MEKEMKNVNRIFLDMDGVLADFLKGVEQPEYIGHPLTNDDAGHTEYDLRKEEITNKRLFANLPPMVDMYDLLAYVKHCEVPWEILTAAGTVNRELVVYDKNEWIKRYVDPSVVVTCTYSGSQKSAFAKEGFVLIDDRPKNIQCWEDAGGIGILHTNAKDTINKLKELRNG
tara:strand:+ start:43 stop:555 length:513 start_codon:yes stop_codon:yes gene_type:complete